MRSLLYVCVAIEVFFFFFFSVISVPVPGQDRRGAGAGERLHAGLGGRAGGLQGSGRAVEDAAPIRHAGVSSFIWINRREFAFGLTNAGRSFFPRFKRAGNKSEAPAPARSSSPRLSERWRWIKVITERRFDSAKTSRECCFTAALTSLSAGDTWTGVGSIFTKGERVSFFSFFFFLTFQKLIGDAVCSLAAGRDYSMFNRRCFHSMFRLGRSSNHIHGEMWGKKTKKFWFE